MSGRISGSSGGGGGGGGIAVHTSYNHIVGRRRPAANAASITPVHLTTVPSATASASPPSTITAPYHAARNRTAQRMAATGTVSIPRRATTAATAASVPPSTLPVLNTKSQSPSPPPPPSSAPSAPPGASRLQLSQTLLLSQALLPTRTARPSPSERASTPHPRHGRGGSRRAIFDHELEQMALARTNQRGRPFRRTAHPHPHPHHHHHDHHTLPTLHDSPSVQYGSTTNDQRHVGAFMPLPRSSAAALLPAPSSSRAVRRTKGKAPPLQGPIASTTAAYDPLLTAPYYDLPRRAASAGVRCTATSGMLRPSSTTASFRRQPVTATVGTRVHQHSLTFGGFAQNLVTAL